MLYENQHFLNCKSTYIDLLMFLFFDVVLGDMLIKKPATLKLEKFFSNQVKGKLKELRLNQ